MLNPHEDVSDHGFNFDPGFVIMSPTPGLGRPKLLAPKLAIRRKTKPVDRALQILNSTLIIFFAFFVL